MPDVLPFFSWDSYALASTLMVVFGAQACFFAFAAFFQTDKLTDFAYGITFILISLLFLAGGGLGLRDTLLNAAVILWGLRLTTYLLTRILKIKKDERFDGRRENIVRFAAFWGLQGTAVWILLLPVTILSAANGPSPVGIVETAGLCVFLAGLGIETVADAQKFAFRNNPANRGKWIESGLWKFSRYPNYFGEILLWWGIFLAAVPSLSGWMWLSVASPLTITILLLRVSGIPLLELSHEKKYGRDPRWASYVRRTSLLVPMPPRGPVGP